MRDKRPSYDRRSTGRLPRVELAPISTRSVDPNDTPTMEGCPACAGCTECNGRHLRRCERCEEGYVACEVCAKCTFCLGEYLVTPERAAEWRRDHPTPPRAA